MKNISKQVLCLAVLFLAGINNFVLGQSSVGDEQTQTAITSMTVCGDNIFAGTKKGVYRSVDGGKVWSLITNGLAAPGRILAMASIGKKIFVVGCFPSAVLMTSDDSGDNWKEVTVEPSRQSVMGVCIFKGKIFLATGKGLYVSTDEGAHWALDPTIKEMYVSSVIAAKNFVFVQASNDSRGSDFFSSPDGIKWDVTKNDGVYPDEIEVHGDNVVGTFCQYSYSSAGSATTCRAYLLWVLGKSAKKWQKVDFRARYFAFDGDNIYAIKVEVIDKPRKEPRYEREIVKSEDRGRSWRSVDEKTDPFVVADYSMQEKLHELDYWKSFEIEEILAFRKGQKLAAEKKLADWQAELKKRREAPAYIDHSRNQGAYRSSPQPDYRAMSQDRFNARHNTSSYIDSKGGIHIR